MPPPSLVKLVADCLEKDPAQRPSTAEVIAVLRGIDGSGKRPGRIEARLATAVGAALAVGAVVVVLFWDPVRNAEQTDAEVPAEAQREPRKEEPPAPPPAPEEQAPEEPASATDPEPSPEPERAAPPATKDRKRKGKGKARPPGPKRNKDTLFGTRE